MSKTDSALVVVPGAYPHTAGCYNGSQAEYVRVPYANVGPTVIPADMDPDDAVLLTDVVPTGYQAAKMAGIQLGDTVIIFGAGPVGIMAAKCAWLFEAGRVIVIDHVEYRLEFVRNYAQCEEVTRRPGALYQEDDRLARD